MSRALHLMVLFSLLVAASLVPLQSSTAQVAPASAVLAVDSDVPGSDRGDGVKFPIITTNDATDIVYLIGNPNQQALLWEKASNAGFWPAGTPVGTARGFVNFTSATVAVTPDGTLYFAWFDRDDDLVYFRSRSAAGALGPIVPVAVYKGTSSYPTIGVQNTTGTVFVAWRECCSNPRIKYSVSTNSGANWSGVGTINISDDAYDSLPYIATGGNGVVVLAHAAGGRIYASIWNGTGFDTTRVDRGGNFMDDPTAAVTPDGRIFVAWRGVDDGEVIYAERQPDGSWPPSVLARGDGDDVFDKVSVSSDESGNMYMAWIADRGGGAEVYYSFDPAGPDRGWERPTLVNVKTFVANLDGAANVAGDGLSYGHVVYEAFDDPFVTRYALFQAEGGSVRAGGTIQINDDAPATTSRDVNVRVNGTSGQPDQYQMRNENGTFGNFAPIPAGNVVPWQLSDTGGSNACANKTVYARLQNSSRPELPSEEVSDSILLDPGVDARVEVRNPYHSANPAVFQDGELLQDNGNGARDGDPRYTREKAYFLDISALDGECNNITQFVAGQNSPVGIINNSYANITALPSLNPPEVNNISVTVTDGLGQQRTYQQTLYYDAQPPVIVSGDVQVVDANDVEIDAVDSILLTLKFRNVEVTDNVYGKYGEPFPFWAVFLANSPEPINLQDITALEQLDWEAVELFNVEQEPDDQLTFEVNWSVLSGLPVEEWKGNDDYQIVAAVVDGAGNVSVTRIADLVTLRENFSVPVIYMPAVVR